MRAAMTRSARSSGSFSEETENASNDSPTEVETGILAIELNEAKKDILLWRRHHHGAVTVGGELIHFELTQARVVQPPTENENINTKRYVLYDILIRHNDLINLRLDKNPIVLERRYTDFYNLYRGLKKDFPQFMSNIYFPKKVIVGNFSEALAGQRSMAYETMLAHIRDTTELRESNIFLSFLEDIEVIKACQYLDERRHEMAVPIFEKCFRMLNKIFMDRSKPVLLILCRLVAACTTSPVPHENADQWAEIALRRFEGVSDSDLLVLYVPLLHTCSHLWWQKGRDKKLITERLNDMSKKGIKVTQVPSLTQAIHALDPRTETM